MISIFLVRSEFESGTGLPSFYQPIAKGKVRSRPITHGMTRDEVVCSRCAGHLGHVLQRRTEADRFALLHELVSLKFEKAKDCGPLNVELRT